MKRPVGVQTHDQRGRNHQAYLWQYGSPGKGVVFAFRMGRDGQGPKQWLGDFDGLLQTDGYQAYSKVGGPNMVHACCLAHARREIVDAVELNPVDADSVRIVAGMDELFAIDREAKEKNMNHAQQLRIDLLALQKKALPKSTAGQASNYSLSLWSKLTLFLNYPELELSTNLAENSMRPIALGRKNWLHLGSKEVGPKIAAIFSVVKAAGVSAYPSEHISPPYCPDSLTGPSRASPSSHPAPTPPNKQHSLSAEELLFNPALARTHAVHLPKRMEDG
jgi:transposase